MKRDVQDPMFVQIATVPHAARDGENYVVVHALDAFGNVWTLADSKNATSKVWRPLTTERAT